MENSPMATKIIHKKSSTASSVPAAGVLEPGELAINLADAKLYTETTGGAVIEIAADQTGAEIKTAYEAEANAFTDALFTKLAGIETAATADQTGAQIKALYEAEANAFTDTLKSKLDAIEASATADQTGAQIKALYEAEANAFTDALFTKLNAIEASATADQTGAEIKALYEAETNAFTDAQFTKLAGIETSATADQTKADIEGLGIELPAANLTGTIAAARLDTATTQAETDDSTKIATTAYVTDKLTTLIGGAPSTLNDLNELAAAINDDANYNTTLTTALGTKLPKAGGQMTGNITMSGTETVDGRDLSVDGAKLDLIEASADVTDTTNVVAALTAGTNVSIASDGTISATDTNTTYSIQDGELSQNNFTDADHTKLNGIEASATADQTDAEIRAAVEAATDSNVFTDADHTKLNGIAASANAYVHPNHSGEVTSSADGATVIADDVVDEANLKVSNTPTNGYFLSAQSGNTGGLTWAEVSASDATKLPLTGGTLTGDLTITDTTDDSAAGPELSLARNSTSPADGDYLGQLRFDGKSDTGTSRVYAKMTGKTSDVSNGAEDGLIETAVMKNGTQTIVARQTHDALKLINGTGLEVAGNITVTGTVDGRDVATDGTKLDGIEASADVTDATNVTAAGALMDSEVTNLAQVKSFDSSDYATAAQGTTADAAMPKSGGAFTGAVTTNSTIDGVDIATRDGVLTSTTTTANAALPKAGGAMTGAITTNSTFDGRDVATDGTKLDGIATSANNYVHPNHSGEVTSTADGATVVASDVIDADNLKVTGNGTTSQFLRSDGDGTFTWATPTDTDTVYTHPNHSGEVTSTADGATVIASNVVDEDNLKVSNSPTNGYMLTAQSGNTGGLTWAAAPTDTNTTYTAGAGLTLSGTEFTHTDSSSQASVNNSGRTYIQDITLDTYGHITGIVSATETVTNTDTNTTYSAGGDYGMTLSGTEFRLEDDRRRNSTSTDIYSGNTHDYTHYDADVGIRWYTANAEEMRLTDAGDLHVDGNITAYSATVSDERLKTDIKPIENALDMLDHIGGYTFNYIKDNKASAGVIAQEVEKVLPSAVKDIDGVFHGSHHETHKTVEYDQLIGVLIAAVKELKAEVEELKNHTH